MNKTFTRLAQIVHLPIILSHFENSVDKTLEICILSRTKQDGLVKYTYWIPNGPKMQKILRKKVFGYRDWNFIKQEGKLERKEICH